SASWLRPRRNRHRVDLRQVGGDLAPALALVVAGPDLAAGRAQVESHRVATVAAHRLAFDREPALLAREAVVLPLPRGAGVAGAVDGRPAAGADPRPDLRPVHREHPGGLVAARMRDDREAYVADVSGHRVADPIPALARPVQAIDAAVV